MSLLVLNAGSSSLKFTLFDNAAHHEIASGLVEWRTDAAATVTYRTSVSDDSSTTCPVTGYGDAVTEITHLLTELVRDDPVQIAGHRVVHGGTDCTQPVVIDNLLITRLERLSQLAPLHNPPALSTIDSARAAFPAAVHVAVFDTAFFAALPQHAVLYPLPYGWYETHGIRRFGFHGISHEYCSHRAAALLGRQNDPEFRLIVCHLGNGCSATAVRGGQPVATTMGYTPLEGLMMGTRCGSIDPGILLHILEAGTIDLAGLRQALNRESGLLGVSGVSADFREVEHAAEQGDSRAQLALTLFADRVRATIGSLTVTLGGIDALVFTAGIGQHAAALRNCVCSGLECLGIQIDDDANQNASADIDVAAADSAGRILVLKTREEQQIARAALACRMPESGA